MNEGGNHRGASRAAGTGLVLFGTTWLLAVVAGFAALWIYKTRPGQERWTAPRQWPTEAGVRAAAGRATLVMFAHPRCACTRASISELARMMARFHERLEARVLFMAPADVDPQFTQSDLWTSAGRIPGVTVQADPEGTNARRFGVETSGAVVLYDARGKLAFQGGITAARGHEGDSFGQRRIAALLEGERPDRADAPVFGCALENEKSGPAAAPN